RREAEGGGEAFAQSGQPLVFAEPVLGGSPPRSNVGGAGEGGLPPRRATVVGVGKPDVGAGHAVAGPVVADVVPDDADRAVLVDGDDRLPRECAHTWQRGGAPGEPIA